MIILEKIIRKQKQKKKHAKKHCSNQQCFKKKLKN